MQILILKNMDVMPWRKVVKTSLAVFCSVALSACANLSAGNLFSHYSAQTEDVYKDVVSGDYKSAESELLESEVGGPVLSNMEKGRVSFLAENYPNSFTAFQLSDKAVGVLNERATISLSEGANQAGSLATNDNLTTYDPADYELGYLHLYLGLNYLQKNDLQGALVEMRRANQVQEKAKKRREDELKDAQKKMKNSGVQPNIGSILSQYPDAGKTLQAVQNGYLLYLSAVLYEADNQLNDAYIDYKRALAVNPNNREIIDATIRVAKRLGMRQDLDSLLKQYGEPKSAPQGYGQVIVVDERGVVAQRGNWRLSLPIWDSSGRTKFYSVALPVYKNVSVQNFSPASVDGATLKSSILADTNLMAQNDLSERIPAMVLKQGLRLYTKDQLRHQAAKADDSGISNVLVNIWNIVTEQPDTRSWQTLPAQVFSSSAYLTPGQHTISAGGEQYAVDIKENQRTFVWLSRQGNAVTIWHKQLGAIR
ncbi:COG3014 family protein [Vibrio litoralis]|uniref:COG3014 family protein n=1 Tax=Vibrio litoralis TaxID=335972 RepID=UPI00385032BF